MNVFGAEFTPGVAWLFSARALQRIRYAELDEPEHFVDVAFEVGEDMVGTLSVRFHQEVEWADTPTFEPCVPVLDEPGGDAI